MSDKRKHGDRDGVTSGRLCWFCHGLQLDTAVAQTQPQSSFRRFVCFNASLTHLTVATQAEASVLAGAPGGSF